MSTVTYSSSYRQAGAPVINIEPKILTAPGLCSQCYLVPNVILLQSLRSLIHVYVHTFFTMYRRWSNKRHTKKRERERQQWMPRAKEIIPRVKFEHTYHTWASPGLGYEFLELCLYSHTRLQGVNKTPYIYNEYHLLETTVFPELDGYILTKTNCSFQERSVRSLQWIRYTSGYSGSPNTRRKSDTWLMRSFPLASGRTLNMAKRTRFRYPILTW